jgi:hypothetical protein
MNMAERIATTIHDAIDEGTATVEDIHRSIAELPLSLLGSLKPLEKPVKQVQEVQARCIGAIYGLIRRVNDRVKQTTVISTIKQPAESPQPEGAGGLPGS